MRRPLHPGLLGLLALSGLGVAPSPTMSAEARRRSARERQVNEIVYRVVSLRESDAVQIEGAAGTVVVSLVAEDMSSPTPAEADDFQERLEQALTQAWNAADEAEARLVKAARLPPHIAEPELDKLAAAMGKSREEVRADVEQMVGGPVQIGEVKPSAEPRPRAGKQRPQPTRETRRQRKRRQERARR